MPLLRIVNHSKNNKWHVDKMIRVEGLPDSLFYYKRHGKNFLKAPWTIDVPENIPDYIKAFHQAVPFIVNVHTPSPEKGMPPMDEELEAYGLVMDYQNGIGEDTWQQIERIIDRDTPRGERVPEPVMVADIDNEHRNRPLSVKAEDIPVVILKGFNKVEPKVEIIVEKVHVPVACPECQKEFKNDQAVRMHKMKKHAKVAVGA